MAQRWIEETFHPHWRVALEADDILHEIKTEHQHLVIFKNATWGTVLMLDGVCQLTTSDEFVYHEMMAHVPLMALAKPKHVLIIGGGDGGVLREALKHPGVARATLVEIDRTVIDTALAYYPEVPARAFDDHRTEVVVADGLEHVATTKDRYDCIIVDSSEPIGPSAVLHTAAFFADCKRVLKPGGILVTQNGLPFLFPDHLAATSKVFASMFQHVAPYMCTQPCYFGGPFALNWASDNAALSRLDAKELAKRQMKRGIDGLKYWTPAVHVAAFALPRYAEAVVAGAIAAAHGDKAGPAQGARKRKPSSKMSKAKAATKQIVKTKGKPAARKKAGH